MCQNLKFYLFGDDESVKSHRSALHFFFETMRSSDALNEKVQVLPCFVCHSLFSSAEDNFDTHFVSFTEELLRLILLEEEIVRVGTETDAYAFSFYFFLFRLLLLFLFVFPVLEFSEISNFANRRDSERGNLDEIGFLFFGQN